MTQLFYLNEYTTNREYGGPEEGGWWFDVGQFETCHGVYPTERAAKDALEGLKDWVESVNAHQYPPSSVACDGYTRIFIEDQEGEDYPQQRPHYE